VFLRSVDSSPFCRQHLADMQAGRRKFEEAGLQLVGISHDPVASLKKFVDVQKLPYPLLSDEGARTIKDYDIADPKDAGVARPATFLVDRAGLVRAKFVPQLIQFRPTIDELVEAANKFR
ncbi:MAG: peroxiredoxin family protein, partial [Planctomycetia bacterium]|nr:peroxiredoxin family protein [Planctomycetia bacterium]